jgi:hypothetical protein
MKRFTFALALAGIAVAGCSSSSGTAPATASDSSSSRALLASPSAVAAALGCTKFQSADASKDQSYADEVGTCVVGSETVAIVTFASAAQRAEYMRIGEAGTGAYPHYVLGDVWAVATLTSATASTVQGKLGGTAK